jgi:hypothetical protein
LAGIRNPHFYWFYFVNEHFLRFLGKRIPKDYNKQKNSLYWTLHLVWLFPWSLYLPLALRRPIREWMARRKHGELKSPRPLTFQSRTELLCLVWAGVTLIFFSFSTNQEYYTFPAYFPILLLMAARLANEEESGSRRWLLWSSGALTVICVGISSVLAAGLWNSRHLPFVADIGTVLAKPNLQTETLSMGHMLDLTGGHPGCSNPSDRSRCCFLASSPGIAIRSDLDDGRHHGCLPDRCAYRPGALRSVSGIAKHGSTDSTGAAAKRSGDDLRRSIVWLVVTFLFGPPH